MSVDPSTIRNPDLRGSFDALRRAGAEARRIAIETNTGIVVSRDGRPVRISADELRKGWPEK